MRPETKALRRVAGPQARLREQARGARRARRRWGRRAITLFVVWHLAATAVWLLPDSALTALLLPYVRPYMTFSGFMQSWQMFAPDPPHQNVSVEADIGYADGSSRRWTFPRTTDPGNDGRFRYERFRNLIVNATQDYNAPLWPSLARYAARRHDTRPGVPPTSVRLVRHTLPIPPPGQPAALPEAVTFYQAAVRPEDLR